MRLSDGDITSMFGVVVVGVRTLHAIGHDVQRCEILIMSVP